MKFLNIYKKLGFKNEDQIFDYLILNLKPSNRLWSYFVNWDKVLKNTEDIEIHLNTLNYLIGKEDFNESFRNLLKDNPEVGKAIPALVVRDGSNNKKFKVLVDFKNKKLVYEDFDFTKDNLTDEDIDRYILFLEKTGIKDLLTSKRIKNLVDYMIGVEAGLDSNARKNRGGKSMEEIVEGFISDLCERNNYKYLREANADKIKKEFNYDVPVDKSSRRYDFVINNGKELFLLETNFYGGGGSKLKSTAGEYRNLFNILDGKFKFIWITDGLGWEKTAKPLRETFEQNDYVFTLKLLEEGILEEIIKEKGEEDKERKSVLDVINPTKLPTVKIPLVGSAPCGDPLLGEENIEEYIKVDKKKIRPGYNYFILRAVGDSMNLAGINDGDLVLCRRQLKADTGDRVVALLGDDATIKMYDKKDGRRILLPKSTNKTHKPINPEEGDSVQGIVQEVLHNE